jgi:hypothetical protein
VGCGRSGEPLTQRGSVPACRAARVSQRARRPAEWYARAPLPPQLRRPARRRCIVRRLLRRWHLRLAAHDPRTPPRRRCIRRPLPSAPGCKAHAAALRAGAAAECDAASMAPLGIRPAPLALVARSPRDKDRPRPRKRPSRTTRPIALAGPRIPRRRAQRSRATHREGTGQGSEEANEECERGKWDARAR